MTAKVTQFFNSSAATSASIGGATNGIVNMTSAVISQAFNAIGQDAPSSILCQDSSEDPAHDRDS